MQETELWLTKLFNDHLAGAGNWFLSLAGMPAEARPWANYITMQFLVVAIIIVLVTVLRGRLSFDRPGKLQHIFELVYEFVHGQTEDQMGHGGVKYMGYFATIFLFVL